MTTAELIAYGFDAAWIGPAIPVARRAYPLFHAEILDRLAELPVPIRVEEVRWSIRCLALCLSELMGLGWPLLAWQSRGHLFRDLPYFVRGER